jgi:hypothetical protein
MIPAYNVAGIAFRGAVSLERLAAAANRPGAGLPRLLCVGLALPRPRLFPRPLGRSGPRGVGAASRRPPAASTSACETSHGADGVVFRVARMVFASTRGVRATGGEMSWNTHWNATVWVGLSAARGGWAGSSKRNAGSTIRLDGLSTRNIRPWALRPRSERNAFTTATMCFAARFAMSCKAEAWCRRRTIKTAPSAVASSPATVLR